MKRGLLAPFLLCAACGSSGPSVNQTESVANQTKSAAASAKDAAGALKNAEVANSGGVTAFGLDCKYKTPKSGQWEVEIGYASGSSGSEAIEKAKKIATDDLIARLSESYNAALVSRVSKKIDVTWSGPQYDPISQQACALAVLDASEIHKVDQESRKFSDQLTEALSPLREKVRQQLGKDRLCIETPISAEGGDAGAMGPKLHNRLVELFSGQKLTDTDCWHLTGEVSTEANRCHFVAKLAKDHDYIPLSAVEFHPMALGLKNCDDRSSSSSTSLIQNRAMGLRDDGKRPGSTGLTVALQMSDSDSSMELCGGSPFDLLVETSEPALVRLYSVASDGRVMLDYETRVDHIFRFPPLAAVSLGKGLKYRTVAVALPLGQSFGSFEPSTPADSAGSCLSYSGLKALEFPDEAALAALDHSVRAPGSRGCPNDRGNLHNQILNAIKKLPTCSHR